MSAAPSSLPWQPPQSVLTAVWAVDQIMHKEEQAFEEFYQEYYQISVRAPVSAGVASPCTHTDP